LKTTEEKQSHEGTTLPARPGLHIGNNVLLVERRDINVLYHLIHRRQVFPPKIVLLRIARASS
jgi:hypothetical protein